MARKNRLRSMLVFQNHKCFFCGSTIIQIKDAYPNLTPEQRTEILIQAQMGISFILANGAKLATTTFKYKSLNSQAAPCHDVASCYDCVIEGQKISRANIAQSLPSFTCQQDRADYVKSLFRRGSGYKTYAETLREQARREHLTNLIVEQGFKCYWCDGLIIRLIWTVEIIRALPQIYPDQVYPDRDSIIMAIGWNTDTGERVEIKKATIDHIVEISDGGDNSPENLTSACSGCNEERSFWHRNVVVTPEAIQEKIAA